MPRCQVTLLATNCGLSDLPGEWCSGTAFNETIQAVDCFPTVQGTDLWEVTSGALPDGLTFNGGSIIGRQVTITGTPTTPGSYTFEVTITTSGGDVGRKTYAICIVGQTCNPAGLDESHLPSAKNGDAYSVTLEAPACATGAPNWIISVGSLPTGLSLNSVTGVIDGIPNDTTGDHTFTVELQTSITCTKTWTISIGTTASAYWTLDEPDPSVDRLDSSGGGSTLFAGGVTNAGVPALIANGVYFEGTAPGRGYATFGATPLDYAAGNGLSLWGWFNLASAGPSDAISGPSVDYNGFAQFSILIGVGSNSDPQPVTIKTGSDQVFIAGVSLGAWHFFHLFYDPISQKLGYSLDNGAETLLPTVVVPGSTTGTVTLGQHFNAPGGSVVFDEIGIVVTQKLTAAQVAYLYNAGAGRTWPISLP